MCVSKKKGNFVRGSTPPKYTQVNLRSIEIISHIFKQWKCIGAATLISPHIEAELKKNIKHLIIKEHL